MKEKYLLLAGLTIVLGCQDSTEPGASILLTDTLTHSGYCKEFVDNNPGTRKVRIGLDVVVPKSEMEDKKIDYLLIRVFGYNPNMMDVPACEYYVKKINIDSGQINVSAGKTISFLIQSTLNVNNSYYLGTEGYQRNQNGDDSRVLARNAPPVRIGFKDDNYEIDSLIWVD